jgi:DNA polymerase-3 subunit delta
MKVTLETILEDIGKGIIAPCYLIYGDEKYLVERAVGKIIDAILPPGGRDLNLFWIDGENEDIDAISESVLTPSLIPGNKIVVVRNTRLFYSKNSTADLVAGVVEDLERDAQKAARTFMVFLEMAGWSLEDLQDGGWKKISDDEWHKAVGGDTGAGREKWLPKVIDICGTLRIGQGRYERDTGRFEETLKGGFPDRNCLILTADIIDRRKKLFKIISDLGAVLHFPSVKGAMKQRGLLAEAIRETLSKMGKKLSQGAVTELGKRAGFDIQGSLGEVEKLITYVGDKTVVDEEDVRVAVGKTKEDSVFDLTSAIVEKDVEKALLTVRHLLDQGVHHLMILTMIIREIRLLLQGKIILNSGMPLAYRPEMDYSRFQKSVYPSIKKSADTQGKNRGWIFSQHPYVIYNALKNCGFFSYDELVGYMDRLVDIDIELKTTGIKPKLALEHLLVDLCKKEN